MVLQRERVLLYLADLLQHRHDFSKTKTDKMLFLLSNEYGFGDKIKFYSFYPYNYGPFSQLYYYDLRKLKVRGCLSDKECVTEKGRSEAEMLAEPLKETIRAVAARFKSMETLKRYVYDNYPDYTVKSKLSGKTAKCMPPGFFSIGYEGKTIDSFLDILIRNGIEVLIDVRANPFSMNFVFTGKKLEEYLKKVGIEYIHIPELGINGNLRRGLETKGDYAKLFNYYKSHILTKAGLGRVILEGKGKRAAMMCMESNHASCHRGIIASELEKMNHKVTHL